MIRSTYLSTLALAAILGAAPAFAQNASSTSASQVKPSATADSKAKADKKAAGNAANTTSTTTTASKPLCSELNHPNAGKLADKDTGKAKEHSASPVHQDCATNAAAKPTKKKSTKTASSDTK